MDPAARATHGEKRALEASTGASEASEDESSGFDFDAAPVSAKAPARAPAATERLARGATTSASGGQRPGAAATSDETVAGRGKQQSSRFYGVYYDRGQWRAGYFDEHGNKIYLATFDDEESAARSYNAKIAFLGLSHCRATNADIDGVLQPKPQTSSQYCGVFWVKTDGVWVGVGASTRQKSVVHLHCHRLPSRRASNSRRWGALRVHSGLSNPRSAKRS